MELGQDINSVYLFKNSEFLVSGLVAGGGTFLFVRVFAQIYV